MPLRLGNKITNTFVQNDSRFMACYTLTVSVACHVLSLLSLPCVAGVLVSGPLPSVYLEKRGITVK
jgi:hypothetical protein